MESGHLDKLGDLKPFERGTSAEDLANTLAVHRGALLEVAGDTQRLHERVEKMVPGVLDKLRAAKAEAAIEWVPGGDACDLDRRYLRSDETVRFGDVVEKIRLPDGSVDETTIPGLLSEPFPVTREHATLIRAYRSYALAHKLMTIRGRGVPDWRSPVLRRAFHNFRLALRSMPGRVGVFCKRILEDGELYKRVISNTSGSGGELIDDPTLGILRLPADLARRVPGLVRREQAIATSFKKPIVTGRALMKKRGATSNDPATFPVRTFTTSDDTISVVDMEITALLDSLYITDAGHVRADPMGDVLDWLDRGAMDSMEVAFLHGDTAGSHQDTIASWTIGGYYTAGDLDGTNSPAKFWDGWRKRAVDDGATASAGGSWDSSDHFGILDQMGNLANGSSVVMITGLHALYTQLLPSTELTNRDNFGDGATLITGEVGRIGQNRVVISEFMSNDFDSTSGLYTGSNDSSAMVAVNVDAYVFYEHAAGEEDFDVTYPEKGAQYVGMVRRGVLEADVLSTETPAALLYNL